MAILLISLFACSLQVASKHSLLGRRVLLVSGALLEPPKACLAIADAALSSGASVRLLLPLPPSGAAASDDASLRLLQLSARQGHPRLMQELGFQYNGVAGQYGTGNRPRVDFQSVRCDDHESLALALHDADVLLVHAPSTRLSDAQLDSVRWRLQRRAYSYCVRRLRSSGLRLRRDEVDGARNVHSCWLSREE